MKIRVYSPIKEVKKEKLDIQSEASLLIMEQFEDTLNSRGICIPAVDGSINTDSKIPPDIYDKLNQVIKEIVDDACCKTMDIAVEILSKNLGGTNENRRV